MAGKFITFEGGEGAGKSTQVKRLAGHLTSKGRAVVMTREPGGTLAAEAIREFVLAGLAVELGARGEALLMAAARADHVAKVIRPALARGQWVICDRFIDSTRVYQGVLGKVDMKLIRSLERVTVGAAMPDLTFLLDVPAKVGLARAKRRRGGGTTDRFEAESIEFHEALRRAYLSLAEQERKRIVIIDGRAPRDIVGKRIFEFVETRLKPAPRVAEAATP
jgi:dTMP kinase